MKEDISIPAMIESVFHWALGSGLRIVFIILIAYLLKVISKRFVNRIERGTAKSERMNLSEAELKRMQTIGHIITWTINTLIIVVSAMMILQEFGVKMGPILASAGIVGVAFGFGAQYLVRDVITGFFIILENQYRIGDVVTIGDASGTVEEITLRVTTLRDADGTVHYIPHGEIKTVSNQTRQFARINMNIGISYNSNIDHVKDVVNKVGKQISQDKLWKESILEAPSFLRIHAFDSSSVIIKIIGTTKPQEQWAVAGELRKRLKESFDAEGIEMPYPQVVVHSAVNVSENNLS
jgi:moderate conductance mechanosensitive channel